ncbi:MAG TPA: thiamine diphosphokinase [Candidatus Saccharimonadales bacterium]|nr:thiamine diphosphokinase [Candidatus Saccharimonadales bacterium]
MNRKINKTLIFLNGDETNLDYIYKYADKNTLIIGCDGGTDKIYKLGLKPDVVLGDFDSINRLPQKIKDLPLNHYGKEIAIKDTVYIKYPGDKDFLDVEAAIDYAIGRKLEEVILVNTQGDELDHVVGVLALLAKRKYRSADIKLIGPKFKAYSICGKREIKGRAGDKISLIPLYGSVKVKNSSGLKYDPAKHKMSLQQNLGISNELTKKKATLELSKGCFLVIQYY